MKDYYAILHVLPSAEIDVIKAAYRALSRKYHPDTCEEKYKSTAKQKMQEINEAFGIIGDPDKRREYDAERNKTNTQNEYSENGEEVDDKTEADWVIACEFCPEAAHSFALLHKLSKSLAFVFKSYLLESKQFNHCSAIREQMETSFLTTYFGTNPEIRAFAKQLVLQGDKQSALQVNRAVRVLGNSADVNILKRQIVLSRPKSVKQKLFANAKRGNLANEECKELLFHLGYKWAYNGIMADSYRIEGGGEVFKSIPADELCKWIALHFHDHPDFQGI